MARKDDGTTTVASNRKARYDYLIEDTYEAGLVLMGTEVKALRMGRASLVDGWAEGDTGLVRYDPRDPDTSVWLGRGDLSFYR